MADGETVDTEEFRTISGYATYRVSATGRIQSCTPRGRAKTPGPWRDISPSPNQAGYLIVTLRRDGHATRRMLHQLVLEAWGPARPAGTFALHRDDNPRNNHVSNLRWGTKAENARDAIQNGRLFRIGFEQTKLTSDDIPVIRSMFQDGYSYQDLSILFGVSLTAIYLVIKKRTWAHIPDPEPSSPRKTRRLPKPARPPIPDPPPDHREYRLIPGYQTYRVSACGNVQSCFKPGLNGQIGDRWRDLKPQSHKDGGLQVVLCLGPTRSRRFVHHLVMAAWGPPRPDGMMCLHRDDDRSNNHISNLRWGTAAENSADARRNGRLPIGSRQGGAKLTETDIPRIRSMIRDGLSYAEIGRRYGVSLSTIYLIKKGRNWSHIPD